MDMFWWLWLGMLVLFPCAWLATYAWNARLLGILDRKRAEKFWSSSMMGIVGGLVLVLVSTWLIKAGADGVARGGPIYWAPFWATVGTMAFGAVLASAAAHMHKMGFDMSKQWEKNLFYVGLLFLAIGMAGMLYLMFPPVLLG